MSNLHSFIMTKQTRQLSVIMPIDFWLHVKALKQSDRSRFLAIYYYLFRVMLLKMKKVRSNYNNNLLLLSNHNNVVHTVRSLH